MLFHRLLHYDTTESPGIVLGRLAAVVLPSGAITPLKPVRVNDWIGQFAGKRFVGQVGDSSFKLGLLSTPGAALPVRGSVVVIVGNIQDRCVEVVLRPPRFISLFLVVFALLMAGVIALSFFGPLSGQPIQAVLVLALFLPFVIVGGFFRREAVLAEQALRQVLLRN